MASSIPRRLLTQVPPHALIKSYSTPSNSIIMPPLCWNNIYRCFSSRRRRGGGGSRDGFDSIGEGLEEEDDDYKGQKYRSSAYQSRGDTRRTEIVNTKVEYNETSELKQQPKRSFTPEPKYPPTKSTAYPQKPPSYRASQRTINTPKSNKEVPPQWNKLTKTGTAPQERDSTNNANNNTSRTLQAVEDQVKTSEEEFIRFTAEVSMKEQRLKEFEQKEHVSEDEIIEPPVELSTSNRARRTSTKSFERFITIHFVNVNALPNDIRRSILKQYRAQIKDIYTYLEPPRNTIVWLVELESEKQAQDILATQQFRFEWLSPNIQPFVLQELPPRYEGKAVLIKNLEFKVSTGDISGFLSDYGVITVEDIGWHHNPLFLVKVATEDAAQAIVLMYHNYQYGKRQMAVYQLY